MNLKQESDREERSGQDDAAGRNGMSTKHVVVEPYREEWARQFSEIRSEIQEALYPDDMEKYIEYKAPFIERIYRETGNG